MSSASDSVVWQEMYSIENGIALGHIYIDENLPEGDYFLNGYTRHSVYENDSPGMIPGRKVKIVENFDKITFSEDTIPNKEFRFEVFPEGGNLITGLPSTLAFKATNGKGVPVEIEGVLYQDNKPLSIIKTTFNGMGSISFTPLANKAYQLLL